MRIRCLYIIFLFSLAACRESVVEKPLWVNKREILSFPGDSLVFKTKGKEWKAVLLSFTQPIPVKLKFTVSGFTLNAEKTFGITEGRAQLVISNGPQDFYYDLNLHNQSFGSVAEKDYRSPKTVNPDSSLTQHRMLHTIDEWRNILNAPRQLNSFYEDIILLNPISGTFRAQPGKALSSFYVQPGSTDSIVLKSNYSKEENVYVVTAGPLIDKFNNTVANGTMVAFIYSDNNKTYIMEASLLNGIAFIKIPAEKNISYRLKAKVNETVSKQIQLLH